MDALIACPQCHTPLATAYYNTQALIPCPSCKTPIMIDVFPALIRGIQSGTGAESLTDDQASCFYHPQKKAVIPCDHCGRFLCALCDVEIGARHLCPTCLSAGKKKGKIINLERHRVLYDSTALMLSWLPIITIYFTLFTAPLALYLAIRHWKSPLSIVRRTRIRLIFALVLSSLQILAWIVGIIYLFSHLL